MQKIRTAGISILLGVAFFQFAPASVAAHGAGASLERQDGAYLMDIGYEPEALTAGERVIFDFNLTDQASTSVEYDYVWVRIEADKRTFLATGIKRADFGATSLLYLLPSDLSGEISLSVRYQKGEEALAKSDFALMVSPAAVERTQGSSLTLIATGLLGLIVGAGAVWFTRRS